MKKSRHIKIAVFLLMLFNISVAQIPLETRSNCVIGIKGIIVNKTALDEAIESFSKNPYTKSNFQFFKYGKLERDYAQAPGDKLKAYTGQQQIDVISTDYTILVKDSIVTVIIIETFVQSNHTFVNNEDILKEVYKKILQQRIAKLGYPSISFPAGRKMLGYDCWDCSNSMYTLKLSRTDVGRFRITERIVNKKHSKN